MGGWVPNFVQQSYDASCVAFLADMVYLVWGGSVFLDVQSLLSSSFMTCKCALGTESTLHALHFSQSGELIVASG